MSCFQVRRHPAGTSARQSRFGKKRRRQSKGISSTPFGTTIRPADHAKLTFRVADKNEPAGAGDGFRVRLVFKTLIQPQE